MKVFIENTAGKATKNIYDEKTLEFKKAYKVSAAYPFPYGFVLGTTSGDGDNVDCFVITNKKLKQGDVVDIKTLGLMEQLEDGEIDHNVLAGIVGEDIQITDETKQKLTTFVTKVFTHLPNKKVSVGKFLNADAAKRFVAENRG